MAQLNQTILNLVSLIQGGLGAYTLFHVVKNFIKFFSQDEREEGKKGLIYCAIAAVGILLAQPLTNLFISNIAI